MKMVRSSNPTEVVIRHYANRYRGAIVFGLVLLLAVSAGSSVFYSVEADSEGVVLRFGK
jgi:regulator of protease activity HflC (stomatin/prohibitin superfamily)